MKKSIVTIHDGVPYRHPSMINNDLVPINGWTLSDIKVENGIKSVRITRENVVHILSGKRYLRLDNMKRELYEAGIIGYSLTK